MTGVCGRTTRSLRWLRRCWGELVPRQSPMWERKLVELLSRPPLLRHLLSQFNKETVMGKVVVVVL